MERYLQGFSFQKIQKKKGGGSWFIYRYGWKYQKVLIKLFDCNCVLGCQHHPKTIYYQILLPSPFIYFLKASHPPGESGELLCTPLVEEPWNRTFYRSKYKLWILHIGKRVNNKKNYRVALLLDINFIKCPVYW